LLARSEMMAWYGGKENEANINFFTRYNLPVGDLRNAQGHDILQYDTTRNSYVSLATNLGINPNGPAYVTGTGASDSITITKTGATTARVDVTAYKDAARTQAFVVPGLTTTVYSYTISTSNGILVEAGDGDDL
jgi:hypothetical protein